MLAEGRFPDAEDLAKRAEACNPTGKWGLFDDTPNSLRKAIQKARQQANQGQAAGLIQEAKRLLAAPTASEAERAVNLDRAPPTRPAGRPAARAVLAPGTWATGRTSW